ncbi:MAG: aminopeptidase [Gemmatimonadota bacterium]
MKKLLTRLLAALFALVIGFLLLTPMGRYIARAAWEEGRILSRRRSIEGLVADTATNPALKARLDLVLAARRFAVEELQLDGGESFTTYSRLDRDTLVLVLSAARRDTLAAHTWWFPIVGRVPYKGFFDFDAARRARDEMSNRGFDTNLRPAAAFSTLGWFNDPLLSTTVRLDTLSLVTTVIHELVHNTIFVRGQVAFNESFASFVGARGAAEFFRARGAGEAARLVDLDWEDDKLLGDFWQKVAESIDSAYAVPRLDSAARVAARDTVYARMRRVLVEEVAPRIKRGDPARLAQMPLDNAVLLARRLYARDLELFDQVYARAGGKTAAAVALVRQAVAGSDDAYAALRSWLTQQSP